VRQPKTGETLRLAALVQKLTQKTRTPGIQITLQKQLVSTEASVNLSMSLAIGEPRTKAATFSVETDGNWKEIYNAGRDQ